MTDMTQRLHVPPLLAAALGSFLLFWTAAYLTNANQLSEIIRAVQIPISLAVVVSYSPDSMKALLAVRPTGVLQLCLGVTCSWIGFIGTASWALLFRLGGQQMWMLHADLPNMFAAMSCFGAVLHISAPGALYGTPRKSMVVLGVGMGAMALVLLGFIFAHPDIGDFTSRIRPYLEDRTAHRPNGLGSEPKVPARKAYQI